MGCLQKQWEKFFSWRSNREELNWEAINQTKKKKYLCSDTALIQTAAAIQKKEKYVTLCLENACSEIRKKSF